MIATPPSTSARTILGAILCASALALAACGGGKGTRDRALATPTCWEFPADYTQTGSSTKVSCAYDDKANALRCNGGKGNSSVKYYNAKKDFITEGANFGLILMTRHTYEQGILKFDYAYTYDKNQRLLTEKEVGEHKNVDIAWNKWDSMGRNIEGVEAGTTGKCGAIKITVSYDEKARTSTVQHSLVDPKKKSIKVCASAYPATVVRKYDTKLNLVERSVGQPGLSSSVAYKIGKSRKVCFK